MNKLFTAVLVTLACTAAFASQPRKVLIIGIDGTRADALQQANTPNIDGLLPNALYTFNTWHAGITISGPSWSDIMCGVWESKHGVQENSYAGSNFNQYPYFTNRAKELKPNLYCAQVIEWSPLIDDVNNSNWDKQILVPDGGGVLTADSAVVQLANPNLDCMFVYFDAVDLAGHDTGFDPANPAYISAIESVDTHIGTILNALYARPNYAQEDWLILLVTDHGGINTIHGTCGNTVRQIWWIANGDAVDHQQLAGGDEGTTYAPYQFLCSLDAFPVGQNVTPVHTDIAVTALHHLIYDIGKPSDYPAWALDGKSWLKEPTGIEEQTANGTLNLYPNPATGLVNLSFDNAANVPVSYTIYNAEGQIVKGAANINTQNKLSVDMNDVPTGLYFISLTVNGKLIGKRFEVVR